MIDTHKYDKADMIIKYASEHPKEFEKKFKGLNVRQVLKVLYKGEKI